MIIQWRGYVTLFLEIILSLCQFFCNARSLKQTIAEPEITLHYIKIPVSYSYIKIPMMSHDIATTSLITACELDEDQILRLMVPRDIKQACKVAD